MVGCSGTFRKSEASFPACVSAALGFARDEFNKWAERRDSVMTDKHRAAARGGARWCADKLAEWGFEAPQAVPA
jgi:hypothetical protein